MTTYAQPSAIQITHAPLPPTSKGRLFVKWITSTDHKTIGYMYLITTFVWFLIGGVMALALRSELARPGLQFFSNEQYNQMFTMHGTIMLLMFATPLFVGFANVIMPLQIGAADVAFPRLNMFSFWLFLFGGTIRENIRIARPSASDHDIETALAAIGALTRFEGFPDGLNTEVRERGSRLSAGERQLVSLARAALVDPAVLVLDEATSNLDPGTGSGIMQLLMEINRQGTTVVMATHDSNIVDKYRRRVVQFDHGVLVRDQERAVAELTRLRLDTWPSGRNGTAFGGCIMLGVLHALVAEIEPPKDRSCALVWTVCDAPLPVLDGPPSQRQARFDFDGFESYACQPFVAVHRQHLGGMGIGGTFGVTAGIAAAIKAGAVIGHSEIAETKSAGIQVALRQGSGNAA